MVKIINIQRMKKSNISKTNELDHVSPEDQEELTFQASQPYDLSFRDEGRYWR